MKENSFIENFRHDNLNEFDVNNQSNNNKTNLKVLN